MTSEATAIVTAVRAVLNTQLAWQGTATELLHALAAAEGTLALPGNARAMAAQLRGVAPLLREAGIEVSFVRSGHAGTRTIHLVPLSAAYAEATQRSATDALTQADGVNAQLGVTSPLPVDRSQSSDSQQLVQPLLHAPVTVTQAADANGASLIADANWMSGVLTEASDARADATAPTATDTLTQTAASDEAVAAAEALTQVAPTSLLTFEQHIVRWLDEHPEPSQPGRCVYCGEMETRARPVVPFDTAPSTHTWLHSGCLRAWRAQRRFRAVMAVGGAGRVGHGEA
jgi:hypothetical protein